MMPFKGITSSKFEWQNVDIGMPKNQWQESSSCYNVTKLHLGPLRGYTTKRAYLEYLHLLQLYFTLSYFFSISLLALFYASWLGIPWSNFQYFLWLLLSYNQAVRVHSTAQIMQTYNKQKMVDGGTDGCTAWVTLSLLELLIAANKVILKTSDAIYYFRVKDG